MEPASDSHLSLPRTDDLYQKSIEDIRDYAIFMTDEQGRVVNWNRGAERILGYSEHEAIGQNARIFFTPEDREAGEADREMEKAAREGRAEDERWHVRRDQTRFWASGILCPVYDNRYVLRGFTKVMRDMTEKLRLEGERDRFFALSMDMLCIVRLDGYFERTNPAFQKILGYSEQELCSTVIFEFMHEDDRARAELEYAKLRAGKSTQSLENRFRCKDGDYRWVAWSYYPVPEDGVAYGVGRDVTELKQITEDLRTHAKELEHANEVKDEFLAILSHELRTPLTSILGWSRILRTRKLNDSDRERAVSIVERNAAAQAKLIEDLLDVSRIITGKLRVELAPLDLATIVTDVVNELRPSADQKQLTLKSNIQSAPGLILGDAHRLHQIVRNILSNSIKFTDEGHIDLTLRRVNSHVRLTVSDTGIGIDPAALPYVFERFKQADASNTRAHTGLGLGLAIVHHLVAQQQGTVTAESPGLGRGATFVVEFPLAPSEIIVSSRGPIDLFSEEARKVLTPAETLGEVRASLKGIRVLLVEDDSDTRELLRTILEDCGAEVEPVTSAREALDALASRIPDVLVSDIGMAGANGYDLIEKVRALNPEKGGKVPAIALTAYAGVSDRRRALISGFHAHLAKPVEPDELLAIIGRLARERPNGVSHE